jgi:hypothetical protein
MVHGDGEGNENRCSRMCYCLNKSIIHFMKENEDKIRGGVKASSSTSVNISCVHCCKCFLRVVERVFCEWLEEGHGSCHGTMQGIV